MSVSALDSLLIRIQSKIESRTRRPWFDLQRGYFYKSNNGIKNIPELKAALEHYHVLLSEPDYQLLFQSFPKSDSSFDFRAFACRLYPKESSIKIVRDGRWLDDLRAKSQQIASAIAGGEQRQEGIYYPAGEGAQIALAPPPGGVIYDEKTGTLSAAGGSIIGNDLDFPVLGETLGPAGTTTYYTYASQPKDSTAASSTVKRTHRSNPSASTNYRPKISYNRPHHQRFAETAFDDFTSHEPVSQGYPEEEYKSHGRYRSTLDRPRFERRHIPVLVEVAKRHNISRQYNRNGVNKIIKSR